ncbi:MAG TPA: ParB/RepB/Spo0J family partition protein [Kofleriaceae bacterium]|jgi:ParB family chromosome partitioning protein|nr:ParB/RepB/Spo0J family partition protein [Kofleriaceae bacterium]
MMSEAKKRGLGRGLSALLPDGPPAGATGAGGPTGAIDPRGAKSSTGWVPPAPAPRAKTYFAAGIEELYPSPEQPRRKFDEAKLTELAGSMKAHGVIVPLVVRPRPEGGYFLIAGERRWRAAQRAGLHEVPVVVQDVEQGTALERALVENLQRADLGPLEEAGAYQRLVEEFGLTQEAVAERIGKDRSTIANSIRLLKLPPPVRQLVEDERLSMGHARALLALDEPAAIEQAARQVVDRQLSVRATEALVKKAKEPEDRQPPAKPQKSASVRDLEERLTRALGGPVSITEDEPGKAGRIEIRYMNLDHLERLLDRLL